MPNCLIVDDSKIVRKVSRRIMESLQYECAEAEDGQFAEDYCQTAKPDVILLDWYMPNKNGIEFLRALRAMPGGDKPVVIFCTTENNLANIQEALIAGANEYVMKPFDEEIIKGKLVQLGLM